MPDTSSNGIIELIDLTGAQYPEPEWWLRRMLNQLYQRSGNMRVWDAYYRGDQPLDFFDNAIKEKFGTRFHHFTSNFTSLAIDTLVERLQVVGFRYDEPDKDKLDKVDDLLWGIWEDNDLSGQAMGAHTDALIKSVAYACVEPGRGDEKPKITVEDPLNTIVDLDPKSWANRRAGLKQWLDPDSGRLFVYVYLPDYVYKYQSASKWPDSVTGWPLQPWDLTLGNTVPGGGFTRLLVDGEDWPLKNPIGVVPVIPLFNRPRHGVGRSEVEGITSNQDLINYYRAMAVVAGRYVAIPQRYAINLDTEVDPATGQPKPPFDGGLMDLWTVPGFEADDIRATSQAAQTSFGQFPTSDLTPYLRFMLSEIRALASNVGIPYYYLLDQDTQGMSAPSGESIKASEARLTRKLDSIAQSFGVGWREVERCALLAMGSPFGADKVVETRWAPFSTSNDAVRTDSVVKQYQAGLIDDETALEELGYTPAQVKKILISKPDLTLLGPPRLPRSPVPQAGQAPAGVVSGTAEARTAAAAGPATTVNGAGHTQSGGVS